MRGTIGSYDRVPFKGRVWGLGLRNTVTRVPFRVPIRVGFGVGG